LRRTTGTFLTNAPGIFGAASAYRSAEQLGHSVQVAERHYLGLVRGITPESRTLEAAMQIEEEVDKLLSKARVGRRPRKVRRRPSWCRRLSRSRGEAGQYASGSAQARTPVAATLVVTSVSLRPIKVPLGQPKVLMHNESSLWPTKAPCGD
jgi:hypothetical protein